MARIAISKRTRFEVFKRDDFLCQYCGRHPPDVLLHCDHVDPVANGGSNDIDNLITACQDCNLGKSDVPLSSVPQSLRDKAAEVAEREAQISGYHAVLTARRERLEDEMWAIADTIEPTASAKGFDRKRLLSIKRFLEMLPYHEVLEGAEIARAKMPWNLTKRFNYFCGVCWRKIKRDRGEEV